MLPPHTTADQDSRGERREELRASFAPNRRPQLQLPDGVHPVLDVSLRGLRIRHFLPERPPFGGRIAGTLRFVEPRSPIGIEGVIVRVQAADVAILCDAGCLPADWVLEEVNLAGGNGTPARLSEPPGIPAG